MKRIAYALLVAAALPVAGLCQTTFAGITGLVTDPNGAVLVGATVTATRVDNNYRYSATTNEIAPNRH